MVCGFRVFQIVISLCLEFNGEDVFEWILSSLITANWRIPAGKQVVVGSAPSVPQVGNDRIMNTLPMSLNSHIRNTTADMQRTVVSVVRLGILLFHSHDEYNTWPHYFWNVFIWLDNETNAIVKHSKCHLT